MIERFHHSNERKLRRTIVEHVTESKKTRTARNANYMSVITAQHCGQKFFQNPIAGEQIHSHGRNELLLFAFHKRFKRLYTRVVNYDRHVAHVSSYTFTNRSYFLPTPISQQQKFTFKNFFFNFKFKQNLL